MLPVFAPGKPRLLVPGLHLPPAQPQDAAALLAGTERLPAVAAGDPAPWLLCSPPVSCLSPRTKMEMVSPQLLPPEFSGHSQLPLRPPSALPRLSNSLVTQRPQGSEPYPRSSTDSSRSSAGPWRPCATSPRMSARSCWIRYRPPPVDPSSKPWRFCWVPVGPRCSHLALQSLDLAEYNFLFALSFTTPTFDSEVAPSFGTLLATVNVALNMLGEVSWVL